MTTTPIENPSEKLAECGWRTELVTKDDGTTVSIKIPLTAQEFLHPQEGFRLPNSTFHDNAATDVKDILNRRYANDSHVAVFRDLLIKWDVPGLGDHCPDIFVAFGVQDKERNRTEFVVGVEGVRPALIVEVVSPRYRKEDRQTKVRQYEQAGVQEYVIIDQRRQRRQIINEVIGYRLVDRQYLPLSSDDDGRLLCETVGVWIGLHEGRVFVKDAQTSERLLTALELEGQLNQVKQRATQAEQRANQSEQRAARLAEFLRSQGFDPDQINE